MLNPREQARQMPTHSVDDVLEKADEILINHLMINDDAMKSCHMLGYNGFKRLHRYNVKKFTKMHLLLENQATDKHRMMLDPTINGFKYQPANLKDHFQKWDARLREDIHELGELNNAYRMLTGKRNCIIEWAMKKMARNYEKVGRWYKRFEESGWNSHDVHDLDDKVHEKYKAKELKSK